MWVIFLSHSKLCCYVAPLPNLKVCHFLCLCRDKFSHFTSTKVFPCCVILNSCIPICTAVCCSSLTLITKTLCDQLLCSFSENPFTNPVSITVPFPSVSTLFLSIFPVRFPVLKYLKLIPKDFWKTNSLGVLMSFCILKNCPFPKKWKIWEQISMA